LAFKAALSRVEDSSAETAQPEETGRQDRPDDKRSEIGMPMDARDIETMIKAAIPDAEVTIRDLAGDGDHYAATVISESFRGKSRVQQHQIVYQSLGGQMGGVLHALALQTGVPGG
jgi:stress-induced morphogen